MCDPEINYLKNGANDLDFIVIGSDGIFDKLKNEDINKLVWSTIRDYQHNASMSLH